MSTTPPQVTVTITGHVTAEAAAGQTVTIVITKPDKTTATVSGPTTADATTPTQGDFAIPYTDSPLAGLSAVASVAADAQFKAANSAPFLFDLLTARTISIDSVA